ncbi:glycosyltransferase family 2 protein [Reyranella sp.]|uniref:glycosyltransferase family 2 protein n=1 Tax=Reyranella sp. TaxID=1929291 RepID=UPI003BACDAA9
MALHIVLVDTWPADGWRGPSGVFDAAARALEAQGHEVRLIDDSVMAGLSQEPTLLTGLNRAVAVRSMADSHRLALEMARRPPDLMIAPVRGGIAQATLMARACGEAFAHTRVALWGNEPTRDHFLASDSAGVDLSVLIVDAMERQCLAFADALIRPDQPVDVPALPGDDLGIRTVGFSRIAGSRARAPGGTQIREIAFIGAFQRSAGAGEFVEAVERLARKGVLGDRLVTFVGPIGEDSYGLNKEWLGQKASSWPFRFTVVDESDRRRAIRYGCEPGRLAVSVSSSIDELHALRKATGHHVALIARPMADRHLATRLEQSIARALRDGAAPDDDRGEVDWAKLVMDLTRLGVPSPPTEADSVTVCILHYDRLRFLRQALASVPARIDGKEVEVIVIDNASPLPDIEHSIREIAGDRPGLRILGLKDPLPQSCAYNRGLAEARSDVVVFLDDDNMFRPGGLERLARAASTEAHDIVVSSLDVFDDGDGDPLAATSAGHLLFLGAAHSAGLFFNAFGDTAMAVRRKAFGALGGFHDLGYDYPSLDWVTLAKAQGAGLRIGALQWPAVRYRRNTARADVQAVKLDEAGARALVFEACGDSIDARLVARYAQKLHLRDL